MSPSICEIVSYITIATSLYKVGNKGKIT
uniref:Uncharacterized protein n=1 Tax=Rhizophora mucronata TaxID=61149 RepID=A0A2P2QFJ1_RHIMU